MKWIVEPLEITDVMDPIFGMECKPQYECRCDAGLCVCKDAGTTLE